MRKFAMIGTIVLAGCASQNQYIRADGRYVSPQQLDADRATCASQSDDNYCMVERGYFQVAADQAAAKQSRLAAIVAEQQKQDEIAAQAAAQRKAAAEAKSRAAAMRKKKQPAAQQTQGRPPFKQLQTPDLSTFEQPAAQQTQGRPPFKQPAAQQTEGASPFLSIWQKRANFVR